MKVCPDRLLRIAMAFRGAFDAVATAFGPKARVI